MPCHHFLWTLCCPVPHNLPPLKLFRSSLIQSRCCAVLGVLVGSCSLFSQNFSALMTSHFLFVHEPLLCRLFILFNHDVSLICTTASVVSTLPFLLAQWHLINVNNSVSYVVCRIFTESREVTIIYEASFIRRCSYQGQMRPSFFYGYASLPPFLLYVEKCNLLSSLSLQNHFKLF